MIEILFYDLFEHLLFFFEAFYPYIAPPSLLYKYDVKLVSFRQIAFLQRKTAVP